MNVCFVVENYQVFSKQAATLTLIAKHSCYANTRIQGRQQTVILYFFWTAA